MHSSWNSPTKGHEKRKFSVRIFNRSVSRSISAITFCFLTIFRFYLTLWIKTFSGITFSRFPERLTFVGVLPLLDCVAMLYCDDRFLLPFTNASLTFADLVWLVSDFRIETLMPSVTDNVLLNAAPLPSSLSISSSIRVHSSFGRLPDP